VLKAQVGPLEALTHRTEPTNLRSVALGALLVDITVAPLENERGDRLGLVMAVEDVTDAVQTKEALIRSERLAAIGRMSAHVTHEIRNPLSSIGLNAELLADLSAKSLGAGAEAEEVRTLCRAIVKEVDRLSAITDEYLRFARLPRPELVDTDARELLLTIGAFMKPDLAAARVGLEYEIAEGLPHVALDPDQLRQALLNLVRNAKESMPQGGKVILGAEIVGEELAIFVRDTGVGIAEGHLNRIFDPFYSTKMTGTGLGLTLTQQIVGEHGGALKVQSTPGTGSEFRINLPLIQPIKTKGIFESESAPIRPFS
jgi:two-component system NtrC family sensor kinase